VVGAMNLLMLLHYFIIWEEPLQVKVKWSPKHTKACFNFRKSLLIEMKPTDC
jgi:hypothetical protein